MLLTLKMILTNKIIRSIIIFFMIRSIQSKLYKFQNVIFLYFKSLLITASTSGKNVFKNQLKILPVTLKKREKKNQAL
jgi:hypothetical protein